EFFRWGLIAIKPVLPHFREPVSDFFFGQCCSAGGIAIKLDYLLCCEKGRIRIDWQRCPKKGFGNVGMNSFNHYAYGAVGAWFYRTICGIQPLSDTPADLGFAHFRLAPVFGRQLDRADAEYKSIHGTIRSAWKRNDDGTVTWQFTVPPNTRAEVCPPNQSPYEALPGSYTLTIPAK
ncbi:MAG: hypothetical protein IJJ26_09170, partial [Victivallales bacterium]|nr:hypothetical protein [Victivallales bacterium]